MSSTTEQNTALLSEEGSTIEDRARGGSRTATCKIAFWEPPLAGSASRSRCPPDSGGPLFVSL